MTWFRDNIEAMAAYVPGEQPPAGAKVIKLNTNENPYPPSPRALEVLRGLDADALRRYPDPMADAVREAAAAVLEVPVDWLLVGNGSDDLIMMAARACLAPGRRVAWPSPTFEFYAAQAAVQDAEVVEVPFDENFRLPVERLAAAQAALTFVANPNSPSATFAPLEEVDRLAAATSGLLVVDEAYADFAERNALPLLRRRENVVILRSMSKGYSLAGLRLGLAVARPAVLAELAKTRSIYTVSAAACAAGAAAFADQAHKQANAARVIASRERLTGDLEALGFRVWPSQANFLLVRPPGGDAAAVSDALKRRDILVRYFRQESLRDKLRITVGSDDQNAALVAALKDLLP